jgi:peroxiredoxin (alkyl hydroperoxide reductase subunit C)
MRHEFQQALIFVAVESRRPTYMKDGCVKPAGGPLTATPKPDAGIEASQPNEELTMRAQVGKEAPDFEANAFMPGVGFETVKLSKFKGKWIVLCFYPGDFTFV